MNRRVFALVAVIAVAAGVVAVAFNIGRSVAPDVPLPTSTQTQPPLRFTTFTDDVTGFSISYPEEWEQVEPADEFVRLLVRMPETQNAFLVRVVPLSEFTRRDLAEAPDCAPLVRALREGARLSLQRFPDEITACSRGLITEGGVGVEILDSQPVELSGLEGLYYFYTFDAPEGEGAKGHYFLMAGRAMIVLVFQGLPVEDFAGLAPVYDRIAQTFTL